MVLFVWQPPKWYSSSDHELIYAKSQILNATTENVADLQAPIYRNVSMFQRYGVIRNSQIQKYGSY